MKEGPLVSVCMPCHNAERYVGEAIESVLNQTYKNIELIVVNDGSTDRSGEVLERYKAKGVKVVAAKCGSASRARNRAFRGAKGEYVKFFDADDILSPEMVERQVGRLAGRQDAVAMSEWGRFYNNDIKTFRPNPQSVWRDMGGVDWLVEVSKTVSGMMQAGMFLIPKSLAEKAGPWNEELTLIDDFEYFCRLFCEAKEVLFVPETTLYYRSGMWGSLSARKSREARASECKSVLLGTRHFLRKRQDQEAKLACANACQHLIYDLYPDHGDLREQLEARVSECEGARIAPSGGKYFHFLRSWIGWKLARKIQTTFSRKKSA
jgi:glycosyltransferase involved in cell wall biosynthesis